MEIRMMNRVSNNGDSQPTIYRWDRFEEYLAIKIKELIEVILDYGIAKPIYIFVSLLNVKGKTATFGEWGDQTPGGPLMQDIIKIVPGYISHDNSFSEAIFPVMTNLAHVFGFEYTSLYFPDGEVVNHYIK
ncbi:hypothetical protein ACWOA0_09160 [Ignavigranum ruoffiae]|nr:hypothetical protein [Ignavigranum ruoffiae]